MTDLPLVDGELIRKDGISLPKDLKPLNPANLK
jgi:hypothetical protein